MFGAMLRRGEPVTVSFRGESRGTEADALGHWSVYLKPGPAGGPFQLTVRVFPSRRTRPEQPITLDDIMVGRYVGRIRPVQYGVSSESRQHRCAGFAHRGKSADTSADDPQAQLRLRNARRRHRRLDPSTPETAKEFSAVAWYFARDISAREHVAVGVIDATWGGTVGEAWVRLTALGEDASLAPIFVARGKMADNAADAVAEQKDQQRQIDEAKAAGKPVPAVSMASAAQ